MRSLFLHPYEVQATSRQRSVEPKGGGPGIDLLGVCYGDSANPPHWLLDAADGFFLRITGLFSLLRRAECLSMPQIIRI